MDHSSAAEIGNDHWLLLALHGSLRTNGSAAGSWPVVVLLRTAGSAAGSWPAGMCTVSSETM